LSKLRSEAGDTGSSTQASSVAGDTSTGTAGTETEDGSADADKEDEDADDEKEEEKTVSVSHILTNVIILQEFLLELAALVQVRAGLFGEVSSV